MNRSRFLYIVGVVAGGLHISCVDGGSNFYTSPEANTVKSAMRPAGRQCGEMDFTDPNPSAADPADRARLYWLAECDQVLVRWSEHIVRSSGQSAPIQVCNPAPGVIIAFGAEIQLVGYRAGMFSDGTILATYPKGYEGCEPRPSFSRLPPPANFDADGDYVLQLYAGLTQQLTDDVLMRGDASSDASLTIAKVFDVSRDLQPRVLTAEGCELSDDGMDPCDKRKYTFRVPDGTEVFSNSLRISTIRVLQGRVVDGSVSGVEGFALGGAQIFVCDLDANGECVALPFEWVEASSASYRCSNLLSPDQKARLDIRSDCRDPPFVAPLDATPTAILEAGVSSANTPIWTVNFKRSTGYPPPENVDATLAIQFTVVSVP